MQSRIDLSLEGITAIVLAAGDSKRMNYPKALLPLGEGIFLTRILGILDRLGFAEPCVVLGKDADRVRLVIAGARIRLLINQAPERGQLSSIHLALSNLDPACSACLVWPVDQPNVSESLVGNLVKLFQDTGAPLALPRCGEKRGHPVIFDRELFQELLDAPLEQGAKQVVMRHAHQAAILATDETGTVEDIDTPKDYYLLTGETLDAALSRRKVER